MPVKIEKEFLTTRDIHELLEVPLSTIQDWASQRRLPGQIKVGHSWRFKGEAVAEALENGKLLTSDLPV